MARTVAEPRATLPRAGDLLAGLQQVVEALGALAVVTAELVSTGVELAVRNAG